MATSLIFITMLLKMILLPIIQLEKFIGQKTHRQNGYLKNVKTLVEITSVFSLESLSVNVYMVLAIT